MDSMPVLSGARSEDGVHIIVWCHYCNRDHTHGRHAGGSLDCAFDGYRGRCTCPVGAGDGHRVAHCSDPDSPYRETGYIVKERLEVS